MAVHWALMRAAAASNPATAAAEARWLATRRGRVFAESTTTDVLRFFNIAVSRQAIDDAREPGVASSPVTTPGVRAPLDTRSVGAEVRAASRSTSDFARIAPSGKTLPAPTCPLWGTPATISARSAKKDRNPPSAPRSSWPPASRVAP